jgi:hypothetical protein
MTFIDLSLYELLLDFYYHLRLVISVGLAPLGERLEVP